MPRVSGCISGTGGGQPPAGGTYYTALFVGGTKQYGPAKLNAQGDYTLSDVAAGTYELKIRRSDQGSYQSMYNPNPKTVTVYGSDVVASAQTSLWT
jgi:hypothetical protein